jgi:hypothetical protein
MCNRSNKSCRFIIVSWATVVLALVIAAVVALAISHHKYLLEKERSEKDTDIKECGC